MGGLLHLVQRGGAWAGCGPAQSPPRCTNVTAHPSRPIYQSLYCYMMVRCFAVLMLAMKGLRQSTTNPLQNVFTMSTVSPHTSRETTTPLTVGCNNTRIVYYSCLRSTNSLCLSSAGRYYYLSGKGITQGFGENATADVSWVDSKFYKNFINVNENCYMWAVTSTVVLDCC